MRRSTDSLLRWILAASALVSASVARAGDIRFNRDIRPILADRCFACHGPDAAQRQGDLRLDQRDDAIASAIIPGKSAESELVRRIASVDPEEQMPPASAHKPLLTEAERQRVAQWIDEGAPYEPHWSMAPLTRPETPRVTNHLWARGPVDLFVLAPLEEAGISPSRPANAGELLRRLSFDLTGLPATRDDVVQYETSSSPDRFDRTVDRLLASPAYGDRLATFWLDLVRFADTVGYHGDQEHAISPYRDWVIDALNDNMPFDQFTQRQLAGDLLPQATVEDRIATGYNRVLQTSHEGGVQAKEYLAKYAADRVRNVSETWLGLSMGCAECHDHKFDPLTQRDFYSLSAYFADVKELGDFKGAGDTTPTRREPEITVLSRVDRDKSWARAAAELLTADDRSDWKSTLSQIQDIDRRRNEFKLRIKELERRQRRTMVTVSAPARPVRILARGDWMDESGPLVTPALPQAISHASTTGDRPSRLDLAHWLTSDDQPMTPRVLANRLWALFFGRGICRSLQDVGTQGDWPTHPELLDWLAVECQQRDWDVKGLVREIVSSAAYRQGSTEIDRDRDPENHLFSRQVRTRLPAEMVRDSALAASGLLVERVGGRSVRPYQPAKYYQHLNFPAREYENDSGENLYRRSVYMHWQRQYLHPVLKAFDAPSREECVADRQRSNTPQAALVLLNDPGFVEMARQLSASVLWRTPGEDVDRAVILWERVLSRPPTAQEQDRLVQIARAHRAHYASHVDEAHRLLAIGDSPSPPGLDPVEHAAWTSVARVVLNLEEAVTRP
jgi:mono/diheme cytochrome c family protein